MNLERTSVVASSIFNISYLNLVMKKWIFVNIYFLNCTFFSFFIKIFFNYFMNQLKLFCFNHRANLLKFLYISITTFKVNQYYCHFLKTFYYRSLLQIKPSQTEKNQINNIPGGIIIQYTIEFSYATSLFI
jgi:hypothetical protein